MSDAIRKAREFASPYMNNVEVHLHLFKGNHYAIQNRHDAYNIYYEKEAIDMFQLNIDLHIRPLFCDHLIDGKIKPP